MPITITRYNSLLESTTPAEKLKEGNISGSYLYGSDTIESVLACYALYSKFEYLTSIGNDAKNRIFTKQNGKPAIIAISNQIDHHNKITEDFEKILIHIKNNLKNDETAKMFCPVNTGGHWTMVEVELSKSENKYDVTINYFNPSGASSINQDVQNQITKSLKTNDIRTVGTQTHSSKRQSDGTSCGPISCWYAFRRMKGLNVSPHEAFPSGAKELRKQQIQLLHAQREVPLESEISLKEKGYNLLRSCFIESKSTHTKETKPRKHPTKAKLENIEEYLLKEKLNGSVYSILVDLLKQFYNKIENGESITDNATDFNKFLSNHILKQDQKDILLECYKELDKVRDYLEYKQTLQKLVEFQKSDQKKQKEKKTRWFQESTIIEEWYTLSSRGTHADEITIAQCATTSLYRSGKLKESQQTNFPYIQKTRNTGYNSIYAIITDILIKSITNEKLKHDFYLQINSLSNVEFSSEILDNLETIKTPQDVFEFMNKHGRELTHIICHSDQSKKISQKRFIDLLKKSHLSQNKYVNDTIPKLENNSETITDLINNLSQNPSNISLNDKQKNIVKTLKYIEEKYMHDTFELHIDPKTNKIKLFINSSPLLENGKDFDVEVGPEDLELAKLYLNSLRYTSPNYTYLDENSSQFEIDQETIKEIYTEIIGKTKELELELEIVSDLSQEPKENTTYLLHENGEYHLLYSKHEKTIDTNFREKEATHQKKEPLIILAAQELDFDNLKKLISNPEELKRTDENNNNFLHILAEATHNKIIELLKSKTTENKDKASNLREEYREFLTETFSNEKISHEILELINQRNSSKHKQTCYDVELEKLREIARNGFPEEYQKHILKYVRLPIISPVEIFIKNLESRLAKLKEGQVFSVELDLDGCFLEGNTSGVVGDPPYNEKLFNSLLHIKSLVEARKAEFQLNLCSTANIYSESLEKKCFDPINRTLRTKQEVVIDRLLQLNNEKPILQYLSATKIIDGAKKISFASYARYIFKDYTHKVDNLYKIKKDDKDKNQDYDLEDLFRVINKKVKFPGRNTLESFSDEGVKLKKSEALSFGIYFRIIARKIKEKQPTDFKNKSLGEVELYILSGEFKSIRQKLEEILEGIEITEEELQEESSRTCFVDNDPRYHNDIVSNKKEQHLENILSLCPQSTLVYENGEIVTSKEVNTEFFNNGKPKRTIRDDSNLKQLAQKRFGENHHLNQFAHPAIHADYEFSTTTIGYAFREELEEKLKKLVEREGLPAATDNTNINDNLCDILDSTKKTEIIGKIKAIISRPFTSDKSKEINFDYKFGEKTLITLAIEKLSPEDFNTFLNYCFDKIEEEKKGKNASLALVAILEKDKVSHYSETIKYLIDKKYTDLNKINSQQQNLLHKLLSEDDIDEELIKLLLNSGINPNSQDENGDSYLHIAASNSNCTEGIIQLLINHGAKKELKNHEGKTAHDLTTDTGKQELLKLTNKSNNTPGKETELEKLAKIIERVKRNSYTRNPDTEISNEINGLDLNNIKDENQNQIKELLYGLYNSYFHPESPDTFILKKNIKYKALKNSINTLLTKIISSPKHSSIITKNKKFLDNDLNFIHIISNKLREITLENSSKKYQLTPNLESTLITLFNNLKESDITVKYVKGGKPHSLLHDLIVINNADILKSFLNKYSDKSNLLSQILDLIIKYHDIQEIYNCEFNYITQELIGSLKEDQLKELYNLYKPLVPVIDEDRSEKLNEILNNIIDKIHKTDDKFKATKSVNDELIEKLEEEDYTKFKELLKEELEKVFSGQKFQLNLNYRKSKEEPRLGELIEENSEDLFSGIDAMDEETISNLFRFINDGNKISEIFFSIKDQEKQKKLIKYFRDNKTQIKEEEYDISIVFFLLQHIITKTNHHIKVDNTVIDELLDKLTSETNYNLLIPLILITSNHNLEIRKKIISHLAGKDKDLFLKWHNDKNDNLLHYAAVENEENIEEIIDCLEQKNALPNINEINSNGQTPLGLAILHKKIIAIQVLLSKKAEPNIINREGKNALEIAIEQNNPQIIRILLEKGAFLDKDPEENQKKLDNLSHEIQAIFKENELRVVLKDGKTDKEIRKFLEDNKKLLETADLTYNNHHLIFFLIDENHDDSIEYLIKNYPNILNQDKDGKSPLEYARELKDNSLKGETTYELIEGLQKANISSLLEEVKEGKSNDFQIKYKLEQLNLNTLSKDEPKKVTELLYLLCKTKLESYNTTDKTWNHSNGSKFFPESLKYLISKVKKELLTTPIKTNDNEQFNLISLISHKAKTATTIETELQQIVEILTQIVPTIITTRELLKSTYYSDTEKRTKHKPVELILTGNCRKVKTDLIEKFKNSTQPEKIEFLVQIYQNKDTNEIFKESFNAFFENEREKYQEIYDKIINSLSKSNLNISTNPEKENFLKESLPKAPPPKKPEQQPPQIHFTRASQTKQKKYAAPPTSTRPQSAATLSTPTTFKQDHKEELKLQAGCYDKTDEVRDAIKTAIAVSIQGSLTLSKTHYTPEKILEAATSKKPQSQDPQLKPILDSFSHLLSTNLARCGIKNTNFDQIDNSIISEVNPNDPNATTNFNQIAEKVNSITTKQQLEQTRQAQTGKFSSNLRNKVARVSVLITEPAMKR